MAGLGREEPSSGWGGLWWWGGRGVWAGLFLESTGGDDMNDLSLVQLLESLGLLVRLLSRHLISVICCG